MNYTICAATEGGFYITENATRDTYRTIVFAGSLDQCLEYVRGKLGGKSA